MAGSLIIAIAALVVVIAPALAIAAFVKTRELEKRGGPGATREDLRRLELRVQGIEKALERLFAQMEATQSREERAFSHEPAAQPARMPQAAPPETPFPSQTPAAPRELFPSASSQAVPPAPAHVPSAQENVRAAFPNTGAPAEHHHARVDSQALESMVAGRWLNYVGILAVLFAVAFFIEYAFQNNWIGARGRVAIGIFCGAALLVWSGWLLRRGYKYFSEGIAGLGVAVLYVSLWAGWRYYALFTSGETFAGMIVVTAVIAAVALARDSQRLALLALVGGLLTPQLVSTGGDHEIELFTYLEILSAGMLALERYRKWSWLPPIAFAGTQIYFWGWYSEFYGRDKIAWTLAFATAFFVIFAALPVMRARREGRLSAGEAFVTIANAGAFLAALRQMLWPSDRWALTGAFVALAAAHWFVARFVPADSHAAPGKSSSGAGARWLFTGLALVCLSLAVPARLDNQWLTIAWAAEGLLLVWGGVKNSSLWLRTAGLALFAVTAARLAVLRIPAGTLLWNQRFMTFAIAVACFAIACVLVKGIAAKVGEGERVAFAALAIAANVYALAALSLEIWDFFGSARAGAGYGYFAQQLGLSILWTLYAAGLILAGILRRAGILRWQALALFGIVAVKVFLFDLSELSRFYRILSFLVLGVLLLAVSFLYQRRALAKK